MASLDVRTVLFFVPRIIINIKAMMQDFESILKEVVQAKRLSASKMGKLTEIALRSMDVRPSFTFYLFHVC